MTTMTCIIPHPLADKVRDLSLAHLGTVSKEVADIHRYDAPVSIGVELGRSIGVELATAIRAVFCGRPCRHPDHHAPDCECGAL